MSAPVQGETAGSDTAVHDESTTVLAWRVVAWVIVAATFGFLINNYLIFWRGWPGAMPLLEGLGLFGGGKSLSGDAATYGWLQIMVYVACFVGPVVFVLTRKSRGLRRDSQSMTDLSAFVIRAAFWAVVFVGLTDMAISFLRVEGFLESIVGSDLTTKLGRSQFRGPYVHMPLIILAIAVACFTRTLGFTWLALLVVIAEFSIVITRFIFSYEQAFQGDLVRFWYAALFLFASAYTLIEEGHVRVDVLYAGFTKRTRGWVNAVGSLILGIGLCWVILCVGHWGKSSIINSPLLNIEVSQSGFGMYVKYLMAGFLGIFAISMMIQFASYLLESIADIREEAGGQEVEPELVH